MLASKSPVVRDTGGRKTFVLGNPHNASTAQYRVVWMCESLLYGPSKTEVKSHSEQRPKKAASPPRLAHLSDAPLPSLQLSEFSLQFNKSSFAPDIFGFLLE
jgi:hypothetical protein